MGKSRPILSLGFLVLSGCASSECPSACMERTALVNPVPESQIREARPAVAPAPVEPAKAVDPPQAPVPLSAAEIRALQGALRNVGLNPGPADGIPGPRTRTALERLKSGCPQALPAVKSFAPVLEEKANPTRAQTLALQAELRRAGFDPGPVDGLFGIRTKTVASLLRSRCPMAQEYAAALGAASDGVRPPVDIDSSARVIKTSAPAIPSLKNAAAVISANVPKASSEEVRILQLRLRDAGFDPGPFDGIMGPRTQRALGAFQAAERAGKISPAIAKGLAVHY